MSYVETLKRLFQVKSEIRQRNLRRTTAKPAIQQARDSQQEPDDSSGTLKRSRDTQERHRLL
ncbi:hypothetical protein AB4Z34_24920 [Ensifer sp. 2YAB10]|uniref:hypothetical protein n=1 Tax=unclassified Ensifer TaxID=2633371 RepID=UPI003F9340B1